MAIFLFCHHHDHIRSEINLQIAGHALCYMLHSSECYASNMWTSSCCSLQPHLVTSGVLDKPWLLEENNLSIFFNPVCWQKEIHQAVPFNNTCMIVPVGLHNTLLLQFYWWQIGLLSISRYRRELLHIAMLFSISRLAAISRYMISRAIHDIAICHSQYRDSPQPLNVQ